MLINDNLKDKANNGDTFNMPNLYIVATPIGNLEDITYRAVRILKEADFVLCEDTRVTSKLLARYEIGTPTISYHQHSDGNKVKYILDLLSQGKNLALVTDAGNPGISDPGGQLVAEALKSIDGAKIISIPGPSALAAAASISGISIDKFVFMGFPPVKKKRKKFFEEVIRSKYPVIFYESSHRIMKSLNELKEIIGNSGEAPCQVIVCRELTKKFETIYRGAIAEVLKKLENDKIKGEFVVIVG